MGEPRFPGLPKRSNVKHPDETFPEFGDRQVRALKIREGESVDLFRGRQARERARVNKITAGHATFMKGQKAREGRFQAIKARSAEVVSKKK